MTSVCDHHRGAGGGCRAGRGGNPFKGLRPFDEADAGGFFGHERLLADVVRRVRDGVALITLVGPSGSGKSSLLGAGVVPALRKGAVAGSDGWLVARMVPGAHPVAELEAALLRGRARRAGLAR